MDGDNFNSTSDDSAVNTNVNQNTQPPVPPVDTSDSGVASSDQNQDDGSTNEVADIVPNNQQETSNDSADLEGNLGPAEPADSDAEKKDEAMEDILYLYKARLIEDLGFKDLPDIEKKQIEEKIDTLVNQRILNLLLLYIPKEKAGELADKAESGDEAEFYKFVAENIPGWSDKVFKELMLIKDEVLGKTDNLNG